MCCIFHNVIWKTVWKNVKTVITQEIETMAGGHTVALDLIIDVRQKID